MTTVFRLSFENIREIISSFMLAEMDYRQRLANTRYGLLPDTFIPADSGSTDAVSVLDRIAYQFSLEEPASLKGKTLNDMAEYILSTNAGRPEKLTFFTSGSTGTPVPNSSIFELLEQEINNLATLFPDRKRIVGLVPRHHIYGFLFSILLPQALDIPVLYCHPLPTTELLNNFQAGDLVIAFPLLWSGLAKLSSPITGNVHGVTSTGPCPPSTINELRRIGLAGMTEVYGSSETGGVGYRTDPSASYTLLDHWEKSDGDTLERINPDGSGFTTYPLQDALEWDGHRQFRPMRRKDNAVQVGGINVYPSRIESHFNSLPAVRECSVRLMSPEEGHRLKIFIVPDVSVMSTAGLESELRASALRLSPPERPGSYTFGPALPRSEMGKLTDWKT